jgi:hypothetical protein
MADPLHCSQPPEGYSFTLVSAPPKEYFTYSMVLDIIWKADCRSACQKYPAFLWNPKGHYRVHTSPPPDPILSQLKPVHPIDPYLPKVHLNVILPPTPRSFQWSLTFGTPFPHACHVFRPPHPPWFNHPSNIRWRIQAVKFVFLPFRSKYFLNTLFSKTLLYFQNYVAEQFTFLSFPFHSFFYSPFLLSFFLPSFILQSRLSRLRAGRPGFISRQEHDGNFSLRQIVSGIHPASYPMGTGVSILGDKASGTWSWPLTCI